MKVAVPLFSLALVGSASAFIPSPERKVGSSSTSLRSGLDDLKVIAEKSNPVLKVRPSDRVTARL
jgi:hypothetical protein